MIPAIGPGKWATALLLCSLSASLACQSQDRHSSAETERGGAPSHALAPVVASPVPVVAPVAALEPRAVESTKPARPKLQVLVSEGPSDDPDGRLLAGYERLGKPRNHERVEVSTDRNAAEFPGSVSSARIGGVAVAAGVGAGKARAMELVLRLQNQRTPFATCIGDASGATGCGCDDVIPYAYISVSHDLPAKTRLDQAKFLSFWARSEQPFQLHMVLSCYVEARPEAGYLDAARTKMDPCWQSPRVELNLPDPIDIRGDDQWHRYQVRIDDLPPGERVFMSDGGPVVCSLDNVAQVAYVLKKSQPPEPGEYPEDKGVIFFDDLQALGVVVRPRQVPQP